jgi:hypothetical protein
MIKIEVTWNCDYDFHWRKCLPSYNFKSKYFIKNKQYRVLNKAFGLRFIISVEGTADKLSILTLL